MDYVETKSADESEVVHDIPVILESNLLNATTKDSDKCKHHAFKKRLLLHSHSSPNLLNKISRPSRYPDMSANDPANERRLSKINDIPDINVTDMSEAEKTDNESNTLNVLEGILALESDTGLSEMDENSDRSSDDDNDI